jgi:hypothetical protein
MTARDITWKWLQTAPLPVVLAITILMFGGLGAWVWAIDDEQDKQIAEVAVAVEKAENAEETAQRVEEKMDKANDKLDKLLVAITKIEAVAEVATAKKEQE